MIYKSYQDMADTIRRNLWKIPQDVDLIVGVPRSGMIPALMIAELLNKRCATLDEFVADSEMSCGARQRLMKPHEGTRKVLVIDDTVNKGGAMQRTRELLAWRHGIIFACVYARGRDAKSLVDIFLEDIYSPNGGWYLYEWNILHHTNSKTLQSMWDIDGLLCKDPPKDKDLKVYEAYLPTAVPMVIPTTTVGAFVTYRLEKYRAVTEQWLQRQGVTWNRLLMFDAPDRDSRKRMQGAGEYKAQAYREAAWAKLFVESSQRQAERIHLLTGKPVYCYEDGRMYLCP